MTSLWEAVEQRQARGRLTRVVQANIDLDDIKALNNAISSLIEIFQVCHTRTVFAAQVLTAYSLKAVLLCKRN